MEAKLRGFWATAARRDLGPTGEKVVRLEKGPAYGSAISNLRPDISDSKGAIRNLKSEIRNDVDWPTYRHDPRRSGATSADGPTNLAAKWQTRVGDTLTQPVVADGLVVVSDVDAHRLTALGASSGKVRWTYTAGGRVDSPPTLYHGLVLFGCADGWVYCLRASDGKLVWRFLAAPHDVRTVACDQVESVWPLHGSVLVLEGLAYVSAGRSSYLDNGMAVYALDAATGVVRHKGTVRDDHPKGTEGAGEEPRKKFDQNAVDGKTFHAPDRADAFSMRGVRTDVLASDGHSIYLHTDRLNRRCERQETKGRHLFATSSLLDGAEHHRCHWVLGTGDFSRLPVAYSWIANRFTGRGNIRLSVPYGLMLAFDPQTVWGVRRHEGYTLFAEANHPFSPDEKPLPDFRKSEGNKGPDWTWSVTLGMRPRALVRAGKVLVLSGTPDDISGDDPHAAYAGRKGGHLWVMSTEDGKKLADHRLQTPPVWDGMAVADAHLYLCTIDGRVVCFGKK